MDKIHRIKCGNVNCHIVENGTSGILVDTGKKEYIDKVRAACGPYDIRLIILTHGHFDHAENAARLSEALDAPIGMAADDRDLIASNMAQELFAETFLGKIVLAASLRDFSARPMPAFLPDVLLHEGDLLSDYGIDARILSLPGHTAGSIGIDVGGEHLLVGDALMNMFYPTVSMLFHDREAMLESAGKIGALGGRVIHFGHGRPMPNRQWVK